MELEKCFGFFEEGDKDCKECLEDNPKMAEKCRKVRELIENDKIDEAFELVGRDIKIFHRMIKNYDEYSPYEGEIAKKEKGNIKRFWGSVHLNKAYIHLKKGNKEEAIKYIKKAEELEKGKNRYITALKILWNIRKFIDKKKKPKGHSSVCNYSSY